MERVTKTRRLDDGNEWTAIGQQSDFAPFAGHIVAHQYAKWDVPNSVRYNFVDPTPTPLAPGLEPLYMVYSCRKGPSSVTAYSLFSDNVLEDCPILMRHLTLKDARFLDGAIKTKELVIKNYRGESLLPNDGKDFFKLKSLIPQERRRYVNNHSKSLLTLRLMHKKTDSPVCWLPKDVLNLVAQRVIDNEVQNGDMVLDFQ
jgi:hypothetical protein